MSAAGIAAALILGAFKQSPPLPVRITPGLRLDLLPIAALAGLVGRISALAHHALEAVLLGAGYQIVVRPDGARRGHPP